MTCDASYHAVYLCNFGTTISIFTNKRPSHSPHNPDSQLFLKQALVSRVCSTSLKTQWEKEKSLVTSDFSFSHSVFYPFRELSATFKFKIVVCQLSQFGRLKNLSVGKWFRNLRCKSQPTLKKVKYFEKGECWRSALSSFPTVFSFL